MAKVITQFGTGITIILDKSAFQSLSRDQVKLLCSYYRFNIPPILVLEILGDLKKEHSAEHDNSTKVIEFANKLSNFNTSTNAHYSTLINAELSGLEIPYLSSVIDTGERYKLSDSESGIVVTPSSERISLNRWKEGDFMEIDELFSSVWREITTNPNNLIDIKKYLETHNPDYGKLRDINDVLSVIDAMFANPTFQISLLKSLVESFNVPISVASETFYRWEVLKPANLYEFAPYASFCLRIKLLFNICLQNDIIGSRPTNLLDLDYIYYLPFCRVFASNDKFHKKLVPRIISQDQMFVTGDELKNDLVKIQEIKSTLSATELQRADKEPPRTKELLSYKIWSTMLSDWPPEIDWEASPEELKMAQDLINKIRQSGRFG